MTAAAHIAVVLKRSSWTKWVEEEKDARVSALLAADDEAVRSMRPAHQDHVETVEEVREAVRDLGAQATWHDSPHAFVVEGRCDLVVAVGGDGTLLAASHGIGPGTPLLGVNSSPTHSVGFFCGARKGHVREALAGALAGTLRGTDLTRMSVSRNGERLHDRILNEILFCHESPAATSRYILALRAAGRVVQSEEQKSSGLWIGPAAGSTAAQRSAGGRLYPLTSRTLQYVVREPYRIAGRELAMVLGVVGEDETLELKSRMRQARLFLDGDHIVHEATIGDVVTLQRSPEPLVVLGLGQSSA